MNPRIKRVLLLAAYHQQRNGVSHANLTRPAFDHLKATLEGHGNTLSEPHQVALYELCGALTQMAQGTMTGRKVFALSTGLGKSSAIVSWISTLAPIPSDVSVAVSAAKIEHLCDLKRKLIANGVAPQLIGLKHSLSDASEPSTGDADRRFMLVSHARVRGGNSHQLFTQHKGKPRGLLVYDESLFKSDAIAIGARDVRGGLGFLTAVSDDRPELTGLIAYLDGCRELIAQAVESTRRAPRSAGLITLPELSELEQAGFPELLRSAARKPTEREMVEPLRELIALAGSSMRVAVTPQGEGLLWHRIAVPEELDRVLVLDASYPIRQLCRLDPTLTAASRFSDAQVKRWDRCTLKQMYAAGGRTSVAESFLQKHKEKRAVSREVVEVVRSIPPDEAVLVFVFKDAKGRIAENLLLDIRDAGIDTDAHIATPSGPRKRINVATWGSETSSNEHVHCRHVILAGVLHRSLLDLASVAVGQLNDSKAKLDGKWLLELMRSEVAHCVFQAMSRGACREVENGAAKAMTAYVILPWPLQPYLEPVTPGLRYEVWEPVHDGISDGVVTRMALAIMEHLKGLPEGVRKVSARQLKEALGITPAQKRAFSRAVQQLGDLCSDWTREGYALVRSDAGFYGFTPERAKGTPS